MVLIKYVLGKTGLFPKWRPQVNDILEVALTAHEISRVRDYRGRYYFYVIPAFPDRKMVSKLLQTFRANGVILHSHYSKHYGMTVYRVRDRDQQFMRDAVEVSRDAGNFQPIMKQRLAEYNSKRYILRELFGKHEK